MVKFAGLDFLETSAKKLSNSSIKGVDVKITLDSVSVKKGTLVVSFIYKVSYFPKVALLTFKGSTILVDKKAKLSSYLKHYKKTKLFPDEVMVPLINLINVTCGVNGVLVTRAINLASPIVPPKINYSTKKTKKK